MNTTTEPSAPFTILKVGRYERGGEPTEITADDLDAAVRNFNDRRAEVPIDYDHSFANGRGSKAAGWIAELFRDGARLMARVVWTPSAREAISGDEYRYISAEFSRSGADETGEARGFTILAAALTNRPFLRSLGEVAAFTVPAEEPDPELPGEPGEVTAETVLAGIERRVDAGAFNADAESHELAIAWAMHTDPTMTYEQAAAATWKGA